MAFRRQGGSREQSAWWRAALILLVAAFAIRAIWFGNPVIHVDEEFYLLVGDRMLHGALPFVTIWDRKPIGLFLLYAGIRWLGGAGIVQYQVTATLFAWGTAMLVARMAGRIASARAGVIAGVVYLLWLALFGGAGGQAPVFYNLPVAGAALLTLRATVEPVRERTGFAHGAGAMLLAGIAIQIKYTVVFEGMFFGMALLWRLWRDKASLARVCAAGTVYAAIGVAPTLAALGWYAAHGHLADFVYANFASIADRAGTPALALALRLLFYVGVSLPLLIALASAWRSGPSNGAADAEPANSFLLAWFGAAVVGLLLFGTYYNHYALPVMAPLCTALAPAFDRRDKPSGPLVAALIVAVGLLGNLRTYRHIVGRRGDAAYLKQVTGLIAPNLRGGCLYVYDGEPILYHVTQACIPTVYAFPNHLNQQLEARAIGADPVTEVRAILARRPAVIVDSIISAPKHSAIEQPRRGTNRATRVVLRQALARDYRLAGRIKLRREFRLVWARLPGR